MEGSHLKEGGTSKLLAKEQEELFQANIFGGRKEQQGFYHADYLTSADIEILDQLFKGIFLGQVETAIKFFLLWWGEK